MSNWKERELPFNDMEKAEGITVFRGGEYQIQLGHDEFGMLIRCLIGQCFSHKLLWVLDFERVMNDSSTSLNCLESSKALTPA